MGIEKQKRVEERKVLRCTAKIVLKNAPPLKGRTLDISASGISVMVPDPMKAGDPCIIAFDTTVQGKNMSVNVAARAVYCICVGTAGFRIGFQFIQTDEPTVRSLVAMIL